MRLIHFTDLHGSLSVLEEIKDQVKDADLVVLSGDITHFGGRKDTKFIIDAFAAINNKILAVSGNCDNKGVFEYISEKNISIEGKKETINGYDFYGLGGSLYTPFNTPNEYSEDYYEKVIEELNITKSTNPKIIISHQPPFNTKLDKIMAVVHVGSKSLRNIIEKEQPLLCLCGHVHESVGIDEIGKTKVVNPGTWRGKNYAVIDIENENVDIKIMKA